MTAPSTVSSAPGKSNASEDSPSLGSSLPEATVNATPSESPAQSNPNGSGVHRRASGLLPPPKGALNINPSLPLSSRGSFVGYSSSGVDSPPSTPSQRLLEPSPEPTTHVQFASYPDADKVPSLRARESTEESSGQVWVPLPLRPWFWISFVVILVAGAVALEVALHFSKKNQGWPTKREIGDETSVLHYVYTLPPVAVAAILVAMWTWTDIEIKKMQPYVDLVHGDSPPHRSLLLDYTRTNNFIVWTKATANKHYLVALASIMVLLSLAFQPLAAALLVVKDTWLQVPDVTLNTLQAIGLNQDLQFDDLTSFLTAAGYASASVLYDLPDPSFVHDAYTVAPFQLPAGVVGNGTVIANSTAVKSDPGCQPVTVNNTAQADGTGWINSASSNGCAITWVVNNNSTVLFGVNPLDCSSQTPPQFSPVVFWFFTYKPSPMASAAFCFPSIALRDVNVNVDLASGNLTQVTELQPFSSSSNFSSFSGNVTGPPLNGRAYNGIEFNLSNPDPFVLQRRDATRLQLPAAVYQSALQSPEGLIGSFQANRFVELSNHVYSIYLTMIARRVYFLSASEPITMQVKTFQKRVWLSDAAVHLLCAGMLLLAFFAAIIQVFHRYDRRALRLRHEPGTIATAVSIGAQTGIGSLLAGRHDEKDISEVLRDKKFRIHPYTMKIIMEGEDGYEYASSPGERRRSIFAALQGHRRSSRHFSNPVASSQT